MQVLKIHISIPSLVRILTVSVFTVFLGYNSVLEGAVLSKQWVDLELEYFQINDERHIVLSLADGNENNEGILKGIVVELYLNEISEAGKLGNITTDEAGKGRFALDGDLLAADNIMPEFKFIARLKNDDRYEDSETELIIRTVDLNMKAFTENNKKYVQATLLEKTDTGEMSPVEWEELLFEVERLFGLLPVEEFAFTDDYGEVTIEYPDDMPGDEKGNITIVVRLEEHPEYGNVEIHETVAWGLPRAININSENQRTWMSKAPPLFFSMIFWGGMITVWGTIGYVFFNVFKIRIH